MPATRATTGITVPMAILVPLLRLPVSVEFWDSDVGEGVGAELDGVVSAVVAVGVVGEEGEEEEGVEGEEDADAVVIV